MKPALIAALSLATVLWAASSVAHAGHTDRAPWDACDEKDLSEICSWEARDHSLNIGSCRRIQSSLMCVRNQPVVPANGNAPAAAPSSESLPRSESRSNSGPFAPLMLIGVVGGLVLLSRRKPASSVRAS